MGGNDVRPAGDPIPVALIVQTFTPPLVVTTFVFGGLVEKPAYQIRPDGTLLVEGGLGTWTWAVSPDGKTLTGTLRSQTENIIGTAVLSRCNP